MNKSEGNPKDTKTDNNNAIDEINKQNEISANKKQRSTNAANAAKMRRQDISKGKNGSHNCALT